eukprot:1479362-Pyramimonas_sp.AAC.1
MLPRSTTYCGLKHVKNNCLFSSEIEVARDQREPLGGGAERSSASLEDNPDDLSDLHSLQIRI